MVGSATTTVRLVPLTDETKTIRLQRDTSNALVHLGRKHCPYTPAAATVSRHQLTLTLTPHQDRNKNEILLLENVGQGAVAVRAADDQSRTTVASRASLALHHRDVVEVLQLEEEASTTHGSTIIAAWRVEDVAQMEMDAAAQPAAPTASSSVQDELLGAVKMEMDAAAQPATPTASSSVQDELLGAVKMEMDAAAQPAAPTASSSLQDELLGALTSAVTKATASVLSRHLPLQAQPSQPPPPPPPRQPDRWDVALGHNLNLAARPLEVLLEMVREQGLTPPTEVKRRVEESLKFIVRSRELVNLPKHSQPLPPASPRPSGHGAWQPPPPSSPSSPPLSGHGVLQPPPPSSSSHSLTGPPSRRSVEASPARSPTLMLPPARRSAPMSLHASEGSSTLAATVSQSPTEAAGALAKENAHAHLGLVSPNVVEDTVLHSPTFKGASPVRAPGGALPAARDATIGCPYSLRRPLRSCHESSSSGAAQAASYTLGATYPLATGGSILVCSSRFHSGEDEAPDATGATYYNLLSDAEVLYRRRLPGLSVVMESQASGCDRDFVSDKLLGAEGAVTAVLTPASAGNRSSGSYREDDESQVLGAITLRVRERTGAAGRTLSYVEVLMCAAAKKRCGVGRLLAAWAALAACGHGVDFMLVSAGTDVLDFWGRLGYGSLHDGRATELSADVEAAGAELHDAFSGSKVLYRRLPPMDQAGDIRAAMESAITSHHLKRAGLKRRRPSQ